MDRANRHPSQVQQLRKAFRGEGLCFAADRCPDVAFRDATWESTLWLICDGHGDNEQIYIIN